jgi:DNA-binding NtrC family response regulator
LFGAEPGSYTGCPAKGVKGIVKDAAGGVLFLDEVECLKPDAQGVLLDFVQPKEDAKSFQERTYRPLGGEPDKVTLRIVAATNRDLWQMVLDHEFREDLYWRLAQLTFRVPSIAERKKQGVRIGGDSVVAHLAKEALDDFGKNRKTKASFSPEAIRLLEEQDWPGNVRQLRSVVRRALVFAPRDGVIDEDAIRRELDNGERFCDQPGETTSPAVPIPGGAPDKTSSENGSGAEQHQDIRHIPEEQLRTSMERELLAVRARYANEALRRTKGRQIDAADLLDTTRQTIKKWSKE